MDQITNEVEKFNRKKERLTQGFLGKMRSIIEAKSRSITQTSEVITTLNDKIQADQCDLDRAKRALQNI